MKINTNLMQVWIEKRFLYEQTAIFVTVQCCIIFGTNTILKYNLTS